MIDLAAEYYAALRNTAAASLRGLYAAGVTQRVIDLVRPAVTRVQLIGRRLFQPNPDSELTAFVLPVRVEAPASPEALDVEGAVAGGKIVDLVAFAPDPAGHWALRTGNAEWLGACPPQYMDPPPVLLHRSPIDWLRAGCQGLVCLARAAIEIYRFLTRFRALDVADAAHAHALRAILDHPLTRPEIFVGGKSYG